MLRDFIELFRAPRSPAIVLGASLGIICATGFVGCAEDTAVAGTAAAESDGQGGDASPVADASAAVAPTFLGTAHTDGPYVEIAAKWDASAKKIHVTVWAGAFKDLLGIAAHLHYDPKVLTLTESLMQPLAETDKVAGAYKTWSVFEESPAGRLLVGSARFRTLLHPWLVPEGRAVDREPWIELDFTVVGSGKTELTFDPNSTLARAGDGTEVAVQWLGLAVTIPDGLGGGK